MKVLSDLTEGKDNEKYIYFFRVLRRGKRKTPFVRLFLLKKERN